MLCRGGGSDKECFSCVFEPIRKKQLCERRNVGIALLAQQNLGVDDLIDEEQQTLVAVIGEYKFCIPHSRSNGLKCTIIWLRYRLSDFYFHTYRWRNELAQTVDKTSPNRQLDAPRVVPRRVHFAKCWRDTIFLSHPKA